MSSFLRRIDQNTQCVKDLKIIIEAVKNKEVWAVESNVVFLVNEKCYVTYCVFVFLVLDASGKLNPGILSGNIVHYGAYDQCLEFNQMIENRTEPIKGKYCIFPLILNKIPIGNIKDADYMEDLIVNIILII